MTKRSLALAAVFICLTGCCSKNLYRGIYEGVRVNKQLETSPSERLGRPELPVDYQQYDDNRLRKSN